MSLDYDACGDGGASRDGTNSLTRAGNGIECIHFKICTEQRGSRKDLGGLMRQALGVTEARKEFRH
jgi:hypothetical protein